MVAHACNLTHRRSREEVCSELIANWGVWAVPARATSLNKIITTMTTRPKKQNESRTQKSRKFPRRVNNLYTLKKMILIIFKFSPATRDK